MSNGKELATKAETPLATARTLEDAPEFQPVDQADTVRIPRLVLVQEKRKEIKDGICQAGELINSLSKENYGTEIEVVPLIQRKSTRIRWAPRMSGAGILCVSRDGVHGQGDPGGACAQCVFFHNYSSKEGCTMNYEIIALVRETMEPILLTAEYTRSSDAGIRDMLGVARNAFQAKGIRLFGKSYILRSTLTQNKHGEFYKYTCVPGNNNAPLPDDQVTMFETQMKFFKQAKIEVESEDVNAETNGNGDNPPKDW